MGSRPAPGTNTTNTYGKKSHVLPFWRGDRFHQPNGRGGVAQEAPLARARRQDRPRAHVTYDDLRDLIITDYTNNGRKSLGDLKTTRLPRLDAVFGGTKAIDIKTTSVARYKTLRLKDKSAPATVNRELASLKRMFRLGLRQGIVATMRT